MGNRRYSPAEIAAIVEMSKSGKSYAEITAMCKESHGTDRSEGSLKLLMHQHNTKSGPFAEKTEVVAPIKKAVKPAAKKVLTETSATPSLPVKSAKTVKSSAKKESKVDAATPTTATA